MNLNIYDLQEHSQQFSLLFQCSFAIKEPPLFYNNYISFKIMNYPNRALRSELSKQDQEDLLKKFLHQQGKCLLIYPEGSNTSLLTALAQTIHAHEDNLHQKISEKLQRDSKSFDLPKKLNYIYNDPSVIQDFKKYPYLVNFAKIILEMFSSSTQRRINIYYLTLSGDNFYNLSCRIVNEGGYTESISIARIENKYYNIQERDLQSKHELSLDDVFKSTPQFQSDDLIQAFKSETVIPAQTSEVVEQDCKSSGKPSQDLEEPDLMLKRAKSSIPFKNQQKSGKQSGLECDRASIGQTLSLREETQLINQCGPGVQNFQGYHGNMNQGVHGVMTPEQMYYMYYQNSYYPGKPEGSYMNYQQQMQSMSPPKNPNVYKVPSPTLQNYYPSAPYSQPSSPPPPDNSQKRYAGRLKFFDDGKNYGFIIMDADDSDIFVHYDDLQKAGITKEVIKTFKNQMYMQIRFTFKVMEYFGKYKKSRKAVDLIIIEDQISLLLTGGYPLAE